MRKYLITLKVTEGKGKYSYPITEVYADNVVQASFRAGQKYCGGETTGDIITADNIEIWEIVQVTTNYKHGEKLEE